MKARIKLAKLTVVQIDPNSAEWKARINGLHKQLDAKYDGSVTFNADYSRPYNMIGYRTRSINIF